MLKPILATGMLFIAAAGYAQNFPSKPIRIITSGPGGNTDFASRIIADGMSGRIGQPVIVENRASVLGTEIVAKAQPDGYTLIYAGGILWIGSLLGQTPYNAVKDFTPISLVTRTPNLVVVNAALPVKSVKELIALAKAKPGELNYASTAAGTSPHLAAELFKSMAGVNITRILYKGTPFAVADLVTGQVQVIFPIQEGVAAVIKQGRLRALAVTSTEPSPLAPGLPTVAATGLPGYEFISIFAMFAPAKTQRPVVNKLNSEIVAVVNRPETKDKLFNSGVEPIASSPDVLGAAVKSEVVKWTKVIKEANIKAE